MRGCRISAVGQESLDIRAIILVLAGLRDCDAVESDAILTEQWVKEIIGHGRVVRSVHILSRNPIDQFTPDVYFDIETYVGIVIGRYKNSRSFLSTGR